MDDNKHGWGTARSTSWATPSAYDKQSDGDPAKLQDGVPVIMKVIDLKPCREAGGGGGRKNTSDVPDCIRFATWNIGTMSGRSAEVVETLHRRKIDVCCVQEMYITAQGPRLRNDLYCVEWDVKLYYTIPSVGMQCSTSIQIRHDFRQCKGVAFGS